MCGKKEFFIYAVEMGHILVGHLPFDNELAAYSKDNREKDVEMIDKKSHVSNSILICFVSSGISLLASSFVLYRIKSISALYVR